MAKEYVYELESENLTGLGGPMGTEHTWANWRKYCKTLERAKAVAQREHNKSEAQYGRPEEPIEWVEENGGVRSKDMIYVMYHIKKVSMD